ncbi:MAG TPA: glycosyltransferase [Oligoflexia bacterium]|nr:glycosyltransferase [Oligoflexia bacterium]
MALLYVLSRFYHLPKATLSHNNLLPLHSLSIIIPARNEEHNIARLLNSIYLQTEQVKEVLVVDDNSNDNTVQIASQLGAKIVSVKKPDKTWVGKSYACYQGAKNASGEYYLFIDADTWFEAEAFNKIPNLLAQDNAVVSLCPYHHVPSLYEQFSAFFNIMMVLGLNAFEPVFKPSKQQKKLFGQCLLIHKDIYWSIDGHAAVKEKILENVFMSELLLKKNILIQNFGGQGFINMRMFPHSFKELCFGWIKAFTSGASQTPKNTLFNIIIYLSVCMFTGISIFLLPLLDASSSYLILGLYTLIAAYTYYLLNKIGSYKAITALLFPIPLFFFMVVFGFSPIIKKIFTVTWKGRHV